jgi:hypothetical protein
MDMRIIEVAIGLVLVFAISSLLVSTLHEIWTGLRKSRGDSLLLGLCSLLGDDDVTVGQMRRRFLPKAQPSPFTRSLMAHPLLVSQSLGSADKQNLPSYLPSDVFINALISQLSTMATGGVRGADPQTWFNAVKASTDARGASGDAYQPKPALLTTLATLLQGAENDWPTFEARLRAWYDSVQERAAGWYRRDTQLRLVVMGFLVAYMANLNPFVIAPRLWNDPVVRAAAVGVAQDAAKAYALAASAPASGASDASRALLETLSKQLAQAAPRAKSAAVPAKGASAPSALATPQSLESEQALRALKENLFAASENHRLHPAPHVAEGVRSSLDRLLDLQDQVRLRQRLAADRADPLLILDASVAIDDHLAALKSQLPGSEPHAVSATQLARLTTALRNERDVLLPHKVTLSAAAGVAAQRAALACVTDGGMVDKLCEPLGAVQQLAGSGLPIGWGWANWPACDAACQARQRAGASTQASSAAALTDRYAEGLAASRVADPASSAAPLTSRHLRKLYQEQHTTLARLATAGVDKSTELTPFLWRHWERDDFQQGLWQALLGWLIIGIGASLGAPFWFDMLGRFVKLRSSGVPVTAGTSGDVAAAPVPDTMARAALPARDAPPAKVGADLPSPDTGALNVAEDDLTPTQIIRLQRALGLEGAEASGTLDANTRLRIVEWQQARGDKVHNGELNATQIGDLLNPAAPPATAPGASGAPLSASATPRRTNGTINVLTEAEVRALYGDIATRPLANGAVEIVSKGAPGQAQHEIVEFRHALLGSQQPQRVHAKALPHFVDAFDRIQAAIAAGTVPDDVIVNCGGTYVPRHIGSDPKRPLSRHTWGIAIDLNTQANAMNAPPAALGTPGSLLSVVPIFNDCGFAWGGHFSTGPDGMHFELALRNP